MASEGADVTLCCSGSGILDKRSIRTLVLISQLGFFILPYEATF